ncbi:collagen alpha-1(I) chain-like [Homarus americanus]|uniref:Uncharacterized protein n=1 Tax=Homarus americanus TaxID=6706 RepID=A0A8J5N407_HOMAM|nr:collagen alpha-1(I) chain-like [Homarus americanus]KAG7172896.1 hypothetical protein Hamer_G017875 [Homarus americanus]
MRPPRARGVLGAPTKACVLQGAQPGPGDYQVQGSHATTKGPQGFRQLPGDPRGLARARKPRELTGGPIGTIGEHQGAPSGLQRNLPGGPHGPYQGSGPHGTTKGPPCLMGLSGGPNRGDPRGTGDHIRARKLPGGHQGPCQGITRSTPGTLSGPRDPPLPWEAPQAGPGSPEPWGGH